MISTILIVSVSMVLFVYWFRYTCLLILSAKTTKDYGGEVATANQLKYRDVQDRLRQGPSDLDQLRVTLERDYAVLSYLLKHATEFEVAGSSIEQRMLRVDYQLMKGWYFVTRKISADKAKSALEEMALVVAHFANSMGERRAMAAGMS